MPGAQAHRLSRHRAGELHERRRSGSARHQGAHHQGLRRHRGRRTFDRADGRRRARRRAHGPRDPRRHLDATRGRATPRQDARRDRPRRHRPRGRAHRQGHGHGGDRLEPHQARRHQCAAGRDRHVAGAKRRGVDEFDARRRDARLSFGRAHCPHEAGRDLRQHRARRAGRRGRADRRAQERPHPPCRARRVPQRAAEGRSSAGATAQRDADLARRLPHAGGVDDAAAPRGGYCEDDWSN